MSCHCQSCPRCARAMEATEAIRYQHLITPVWLRNVLKSRSIEKAMNRIEKKLHEDAERAE